MEMIIGQLHYFGASLLWGIILMFLYDFLEIFRCQIHHNRVWLFLEDWFFWLVAAILVFQMIFALNHGIIRSFFVLSFIGGMGLYRGLVKRRFVCGALAVIAWILRPFVWLRGIIQKKREKTQKNLEK